MKITKKQLKRIIAEEHALVYGKPSKTKARGRRRPSSRRVTKRALAERRMIARRKKEIIIEAKAELIASQMMTEGWFKNAIAGMKGALGAVGGEIEKMAAPITQAANNTIKAYKDSAKKQKDDDKADFLENLPEKIAKPLAKELWGEFSKELAKKMKKLGFSDEETQQHIAAQSSMWASAGNKA